MALPLTDPARRLEVITTSVLDGLDEIAARMERKWGVGRLRLLVDDGLRQRFDLQAEKLRLANARLDLEGQTKHGAAMRRAWKSLDAAAEAAGCEPLSPNVWEIPLPSGEVVALVRTEAEAHVLAPERGEVFTAAEIGNLIERLGRDVRLVRRAFAGARITGVREVGPEEVTGPPIDLAEPEPGFDWVKGDRIDDLFDDGK